MDSSRLAPYDLSAGKHPFTRCPGCNNAWAPTIWVVLDLSHRRDVLLSIRNESLHHVRCGLCRTTVAVNSSVLVVQGGRLIFSPSPGSTSLDDHNQLVYSLGLLQQALGERWDDTLLQDLEVVVRPLLASAIEPSSYGVAGLVKALQQANNGWKQQYLFATCPEVYADEVTEQLDKEIEVALQAVNATLLADLRVKRGLLTDCRRAGISNIRALLPKPSVYEPQSDLNEILNETAAAFLSNQTDMAIVGLLAISDLDIADNPLLLAELRIVTVERIAARGATRAQITDQSSEVNRHVSAAVDHRLAALGASGGDTSRARECLCETVVAAGFSFGPWLTLDAEARVRLAAIATEDDLIISHLSAALAAFAVLGDEDRIAAEYDTLGYFHYTRTAGDRSKHIEAALTCYQAGAEHINRDFYPDNWAAMQFNIGNAYLELEAGDRVSNLKNAVLHLTQAAVEQAKPPESTHLPHTLMRLTAARTEHDEFQCARDPRSAALFEAVVAMERQDWERALGAYQSAIAKTEELLEAVHSEERRREVFDDFGTAYAAAAYACFRLGRFSEAVSYIQSGRSRVLSEEVDVFDIAMDRLTPQLRDRLQEAREEFQMLRLSKFVARPGTGNKEAEAMVAGLHRDASTKLNKVISDISEVAPDAVPRKFTGRQLVSLCPHGGALVLPIFSIAGCCLLVITGRDGPLTQDDLLWIDDFTDNDLIELLSDWSNAQNTDGRGYRRQALTTLCQTLWQLFARHILKRLEELKITTGAPVVVLPQGGLGLLPLASASPSPDSGGGLLDAYAISYAPSLNLLSLMQRRASVRSSAADSLAAVVDPLGDLDYSRAEGGLIAALFPQGQIDLLEGGAACGQQLGKVVVNRKYLHLGCHAHYTTDGGNFSGLYLAHDAVSLDRERSMAGFEKRPALENFFLAGQRWIPLNLDLSHCRLVTLSACESGNVDFRRPDEFLGLPAAFLRAGAAAVICTLWRVDDVASMLLTARIYEELLHDDLNPATALRNAQHWLRDSTNESLARYYEFIRDKAGANNFPKKLERELRRHALGTPLERPFSHPYFWAAFVLIGSEP